MARAAPDVRACPLGAAHMLQAPWAPFLAHLPDPLWEAAAAPAWDLLGPPCLTPPTLLSVSFLPTAD